MSRLPQLMRRPAVVTTVVAAVLVAVAFTFLLLRPRHTIPVATPEPSGTSAPSFTTGASAPASPTSSQAAAASVTSAATRPAARPASGSKAIGWLMEFTPGGMGGPPSAGYHSYAAFSTTSCGAVTSSTAYLTGPLRTLYEGAAAVCMAAFHGHPEEWQQAESDFSQLSAGSPAFGCLDRDVYLMLGALISMHRQFPHHHIVRGSPSATHTTCPRIIEVTPDHGPAQGGEQVRIRGVNLPASLVVDFDNVTAEPVQSNGTEATLITPPLGDVDLGLCPCKASVFVHDLWYVGAAHYTYDPPVAATASTGTP